ncbi:MAG: hypothetical protein U5K27_14160 [Desulfotignum sp.]|nr:hypothetical protein [Desulfotignum sp.]
MHRHRPGAAAKKAMVTRSGAFPVNSRIRAACTAAEAAAPW